MKVTVAGASGFIGRNLIDKISKDINVNALSRYKQISSYENVEWNTADLFSLGSTAMALNGTDIAIYLVHSMMPSTRLFQGNFHDSDIFLADNFSRACSKAGVKQIIYLGGLVPNTIISDHLEARKDVEDVLKASGIPVTVFRAGMIVGDHGSSFEILKALAINLPVMILPKWTKALTQVVFVDDVISCICRSIGNEKFYNKTINLVNGEDLTYEELIKKNF